MMLLLLGYHARGKEVIEVWIVSLCAEGTYQQPPRGSVTDQCQPYQDDPCGSAVTGVGMYSRSRRQP